MLWEKLLKNYTLNVPQFSYLMESWIIWIMGEILEVVKFAKVKFGTNSSLALQISLKWTRFWIFYFDNYFYWKYASNTHNSISSILTEKKTSILSYLFLLFVNAGVEDSFGSTVQENFILSRISSTVWWKTEWVNLH